MSTSTAPVSQARIAEHVARLGEDHPPLSLGPVDRTLRDARAVAARFGGVIDYMARVELEVERNVLELLMLLPGVGETDRHFYQDVWGPQEVQHGLILDQLQVDLGMAAATPDVAGVSARVKVLSHLAHLAPVQDVVRLMYYLTGAATERSAVVAYNTLESGLTEMGEDAVARTIIAPIKRQEPGHLAFYSMSARAMVAAGELAPWQMRLARFLRSRSFGLVGVNNPTQLADAGAMIVATGVDADLQRYARDISRVEANLLWAHRRGMEVPGYVLAALREAIEAYRARGVLTA